MNRLRNRDMRPENFGATPDSGRETGAFRFCSRSCSWWSFELRNCGVGAGKASWPGKSATATSTPTPCLGMAASGAMHPRQRIRLNDQGGVRSCEAPPASCGLALRNLLRLAWAIRWIGDCLIESGQEWRPNGGNGGSTMGWMPQCCGAPASGAEARGGSGRNRIFGIRIWHVGCGTSATRRSHPKTGVSL